MSEIVIHPEVAAALADGRGVVALESTILSHGLPRPENREIAAQIETAVRSHGAVPATIAVIDGQLRVGLDEAGLDRMCTDTEVVKLSIRDLGIAVAKKLTGATTVASTSAIAARAGINIFATGGLGGVHRGWEHTLDMSADLQALARIPILIVCAGVKSILDVPATLEYLETVSVPVLGYQTYDFPGFYLTSSGTTVPWRIESAAEAAAILRARTDLGVDTSGMLVANPLPESRQMDPATHDRLLEAALTYVEDNDIHGKDVTPALLEHFHTASGGESVRVNVELVLSNAALAAQIAANYA